MNILVKHEDQTALNFYIGIKDSKVKLSCVKLIDNLESKQCQELINKLSDVDTFLEQYFKERENTQEHYNFIKEIFTTKINKFFEEKKHFSVVVID